MKVETSEIENKKKLKTKNKINIGNIYTDSDYESCGYCKKDKSKKIISFSTEFLHPIDYEILMFNGFRKCGSYYYKPDLEGSCCKLFPIRLDIHQFIINKNQQKVVKKFRNYLTKKEVNSDNIQIYNKNDISKNISINNNNDNIINNPNYNDNLTNINLEFYKINIARFILDKISKDKAKISLFNYFKICTFKFDDHNDIIDSNLNNLIIYQKSSKTFSCNVFSLLMHKLIKYLKEFGLTSVKKSYDDFLKYNEKQNIDYINEYLNENIFDQINSILILESNENQNTTINCEIDLNEIHSNKNIKNSNKNKTISLNDINIQKIMMKNIQDKISNQFSINEEVKLFEKDGNKISEFSNNLTNVISSDKKILIFSNYDNLFLNFTIKNKEDNKQIKSVENTKCNNEIKKKKKVKINEINEADVQNNLTDVKDSSNNSINLNNNTNNNDKIDISMNKNKNGNEDLYVFKEFDEIYSLPEIKKSEINKCYRIVLDFCDEKSKYFREKINLWKDYQLKVHKDTRDKTDKSYLSSWGKSCFIQDQSDSIIVKENPHMDLSILKHFGTYNLLHIIDDKIVAVSVLDILPSSVSAVYCYYDNDLSQELSLGIFTAIKEIEFTKHLNKYVSESIKFYCMGFYIPTCQKMVYKRDYFPSQILCPKTKNFCYLNKDIISLSENIDSMIDPCLFSEKTYYINDSIESKDCLLKDNLNMNQNLYLIKDDNSNTNTNINSKNGKTKINEDLNNVQFNNNHNRIEKLSKTEKLKIYDNLMVEYNGKLYGAKDFISNNISKQYKSQIEFSVLKLIENAGNRICSPDNLLLTIK